VWYVVTNIWDGYAVSVFRVLAKMLVAIHKDYIMSQYRRLNSIYILQGKPGM